MGYAAASLPPNDECTIHDCHAPAANVLASGTWCTFCHEACSEACGQACRQESSQDGQEAKEEGWLLPLSAEGHKPSLEAPPISRSSCTGSLRLGTTAQR